MDKLASVLQAAIDTTSTAARVLAPHVINTLQARAHAEASVSGMMFLVCAIVAAVSWLWTIVRDDYDTPVLAVIASIATVLSGVWYASAVYTVKVISVDPVGYTVLTLLGK